MGHHSRKPVGRSHLNSPVLADRLAGAVHDVLVVACDVRALRE